MAQVELRDVHKYYGDVYVVKGVSISVTPGEFLVLVGPSGCGKSTCLRMIAGLESISKGTLHIGDQVVNDMPPKDRNIGMVFQSYALYPHMTVRENLAFGPKLRKETPQHIEERIAEASRILELDELLERKPAKLSGGQRQRVAIGRAIVKQPAVFLFDEPLSNLDAALRLQMRTELARLHQKLKTTMIYVTHDQVEAMMLADRIAILSEGVLQQIGRPMDVYRRPANRFVASFIGSPAMNFAALHKKGESFECLGAALELKEWPTDISTDGLELGIRPQDIDIGQGEISGRVSLVEMLGWEAFVHVDVKGHTLVARVEGNAGDEVKEGQEISLSLRRAGIHIFDSKGEACWRGADHYPA